MSLEMNFDKKHQTFSVSVLFLDDSKRVFQVEVIMICFFRKYILTVFWFLLNRNEQRAQRSWTKYSVISRFPRKITLEYNVWPNQARSL